jgi:hypothetical protein
MTKKNLKVKDIERLENTSVASALVVATVMDNAPHENLGCQGVSCEGAGATACNGINATIAQICTVVGGVCCTGCTVCTVCSACSSCTVCTGSTVDF